MTLAAAGGELALDFAPEIAALAAAQRRLADHLEAAGIAPDLLLRTELVVEEAVMNVIHHGRPAGAAHVRIHAALQEGGVQIVVEDDGPPFDPLAAAPKPLPGSLDAAGIGGFGLHLLRANAARLAHARTETGRNQLSMLLLPRKKRDGGRDRD